MAVQILTVTGDSLQALLDNVNTAMAAMLDRVINRVEFEIAGEARYIGRDYRLTISHTLATTPVAAPFLATGFERQSPSALETALQAYINTIPTQFCSSAYTTQLVSGSRTIQRCSGFVFASTDAVQGPINWQAGGGSGGGGGGGGDHPSLTDRDLINQHPAKAVSMDAATALASGANTPDTITAAAWQAVTWHIEMDNAADTSRVSSVRAVVDNAGAVALQEYGVVLVGATDPPTIDVTYSGGAFNLVITTPGAGWTARVRRDSQF